VLKKRAVELHASRGKGGGKAARFREVVYETPVGLLKQSSILGEHRGRYMDPWELPLHCKYDIQPKLRKNASHIVDETPGFTLCTATTHSPIMQSRATVAAHTQFRNGIFLTTIAVR
jgi:hypothetical protein